MNDFLNFTDYTVFQVALNLTASTLWVIAYILILKNVKKNQYIEMPIAAAMGNFMWELLWAFYFKINMGLLLIWGIRAWLVLDVFIVYLLFKVGPKQIQTPLLRKNIRYLMPLMMLIWGAFFFTFTTMKFDTPMGAHSALILNLLMSCMYLVQGMRTDTIKYHSMGSAVTKGLGTGLFTVFIYIATPLDYLSMMLGAAVFCVDSLYVYHIWKGHAPDTAGLQQNPVTS